MSNTKVSSFKERFKELFDESDTTATELAKKLHVSNQTISAWKTGDRSPKELTIIAIARYFGVSVPWLMGFDVEKETYYSDRDKLAELSSNEPRTYEAQIISSKVDRLPKEQREKLLSVVNNLFDAFFEDK